MDARTATPTGLPFEKIEKLAREMIQDATGIVSVPFNIASKPPSTIGAV